MPVPFGLGDAEVQLNGSHTVEGWSDADDALMLPDKIPVAVAKFGADGKMAAYSTGQQGGPVMYKLLATSNTAAFLYRELVKQRKGEEQALQWTCDVSHANSGVSIHMEGGILTDGPMGPRLGAGNAADEEFEITFETINANYDSANFDGGGGGGGGGSPGTVSDLLSQIQP